MIYNRHSYGVYKVTYRNADSTKWSAHKSGDGSRVHDNGIKNFATKSMLEMSHNIGEKFNSDSHPRVYYYYHLDYEKILLNFELGRGFAKVVINHLLVAKTLFRSISDRGGPVRKLKNINVNGA